MHETVKKQSIIAGKEAFYDDEKNLWGTYLGLNDKNKTLIATIWGKTETESLSKAEKMRENLTMLS